jgi:hypothetical protein
MGKVKSLRLKPGTRVDRYKIVETLGRGWEGEVYAVEEVPTTAKYSAPQIGDQELGPLMPDLIGWRHAPDPDPN